MDWADKNRSHMSLKLNEIWSIISATIGLREQADLVQSIITHHFEFICFQYKGLKECPATDAIIT